MGECGCDIDAGDVCNEHLDWRTDRCEGEPGAPGWFGRDSEHDLAGPDGYCRGCPDCEPEADHATLLEGVERRPIPPPPGPPEPPVPPANRWAPTRFQRLLRWLWRR